MPCNHLAARLSKALNTRCFGQIKTRTLLAYGACHMIPKMFLKVNHSKRLKLVWCLPLKRAIAAFFRVETFSVNTFYLVENGQTLFRLGTEYSESIPDCSKSWLRAYQALEKVSFGFAQIYIRDSLVLAKLGQTTGHCPPRTSERKRSRRRGRKKLKVWTSNTKSKIVFRADYLEQTWNVLNKQFTSFWCFLLLRNWLKWVKRTVATKGRLCRRILIEVFQ